MLKRIVDIIIAMTGIMVSSPLLLFLSLMIKSEDGGPIFYSGARTGRNGIPFRMYKFRTMAVNTEKNGGSSTADGDPRITKIGMLLRKSKLDELPQLINVLIGNMSIVGPRPEVQRYTDMYTKEEKAILTVRPGITDWASIWNADEGAALAGMADPEKAYEELIRPTKLKLQLKYVYERSFLTDLKIIILTLLAIINPGSKAVEDIREFKIY